MESMKIQMQTNNSYHSSGKVNVYVKLMASFNQIQIQM